MISRKKCDMSSNGEEKNDSRINSKRNNVDHNYNAIFFKLTYNENTAPRMKRVNCI